MKSPILNPYPSRFFHPKDRPFDELLQSPLFFFVESLFLVHNLAHLIPAGVSKFESKLLKP